MIYELPKNNFTKQAICSVKLKNEQTNFTTDVTKNTTTSPVSLYESTSLLIEPLQRHSAMGRRRRSVRRWSSVVCWSSAPPISQGFHVHHLQPSRSFSASSPHPVPMEKSIKFGVQFYDLLQLTGLRLNCGNFCCRRMQLLCVLRSGS